MNEEHEKVRKAVKKYIMETKTAGEEIQRAQMNLNRARADLKKSLNNIWAESHESDKGTYHIPESIAVIIGNTAYIVEIDEDLEPLNITSATI